MLSEENRKKIIENGLYKNDKLKSEAIPSSMGLYHCRNYTFYPHFYEDKIFMYDSYFNDWDSHIEVTDENFSDWEFIFDRTQVIQISYSESLEYDEKDLYCNVATNSGGYSCSSCIWINKNAEKNIDKQIEQAKYRVNSAKHQLEWEEKELEELEAKKKDKEVKENE